MFRGYWYDYISYTIQSRTTTSNRQLYQVTELAIAELCNANHKP